MFIIIFKLIYVNTVLHHWIFILFFRVSKIIFCLFLKMFFHRVVEKWVACWISNMLPFLNCWTVHDMMQNNNKTNIIQQICGNKHWRDCYIHCNHSNSALISMCKQIQWKCFYWVVVDSYQTHKVIKPIYWLWPFVDYLSIRAGPDMSRPQVTSTRVNIHRGRRWALSELRRP